MGKYRIVHADQIRAACDDALLWLVKFNPDLVVARHDQYIEIYSPFREPEAIALLWKASLLTEIRRDGSALQRRRNLEELVR